MQLNQKLLLDRDLSEVGELAMAQEVNYSIMELESRPGGTSPPRGAPSGVSWERELEGGGGRGVVAPQTTRTGHELLPPQDGGENFLQVGGRRYCPYVCEDKL